MTTTNEPLENLGKQIDTMLKNSQHNATVVHNSKFLANRYIVSDEYKESLNNRITILTNEISLLETKKDSIITNLDESTSINSAAAGYTGATNNFINKGKYYTPENKVIKIKAELSDDSIINLIFIHSHGDETKYQ